MNFSDGVRLPNGKVLRVYNIAKKDILNKDYEGVLSFIALLDKLGGRKSHGNALIMVDGYNDVVEELYEIMEVREYVQGLFKLVPHLLYYINFELDGHAYLINCLTDITTVLPINRKSPIELHMEHLGNPDTLPHYTSKLTFKREVINKMYADIRAHAKRVKRQELGEKTIYQIEKLKIY